MTRRRGERNVDPDNLGDGPEIRRVLAAGLRGMARATEYGERNPPPATGAPGPGLPALDAAPSHYARMR